MQLDSEQILSEALKLPLELRGKLAARVLESLDDLADYDDEWGTEIERRIHECRTDPNSCVPWEVACKMIMEDDD